MAKHFIAVLGTGLYEPVTYKTDTFTASREYEFVQFAIIEQYLEELSKEDTKITIFVTEGDRGSEKLNYLSRNYNAADLKSAHQWAEARAQKVIVGNKKPGFEDLFKEEFPMLSENIEAVHIPDAKNEDEIWEIFNTIYDTLRDGDEIIFDITHAFRSIPMLALAIVNYAKVLKNCSLINISYGAFKYGQKEAEIINLTPFNQIMEWSTAADVFTHFGNATMIKKIFEKEYKAASLQDKKIWGQVKPIINSADYLSDAIQTCRGVDTDDEYVKTKDSVNKRSIKKAYQYFVDSVKRVGTEKVKRIRPLAPLFDKVISSFKIFNKENNYEIGLSVVKWSIDNEMIQQGYTALEESIKTYLCYYYEVDQVREDIRDGIIGRSLNIMAKARENRIKIDTFDDRQKYYEKLKSENTWNLEFLNKGNTNISQEKIYEIIKDIICHIDLGFIKEIKEIKDERNDINHFGMRPDPRCSDTLVKKLEQHYGKIKDIIGKMNAEKDLLNRSIENIIDVHNKE